MIYNYQFQHKYNNATISIQVRTDEGEEEADYLANVELTDALNSEQIGWFVSLVEEEEED
jgi:predicted 3-demethylubiquinone-9 3-methyltransferase (glyoxalase superfamily)